MKQSTTESIILNAGEFRERALTTHFRRSPVWQARISKLRKETQLESGANGDKRGAAGACQNSAERCLEKRTDKQRGIANPAINAFGVAPSSFTAWVLSRDAFQTAEKKRRLWTV